MRQVVGRDGIASVQLVGVHQRLLGAGDIARAGLADALRQHGLGALRVGGHGDGALKGLRRVVIALGLAVQPPQVVQGVGIAWVDRDGALEVGNRQRVVAQRHVDQPTQVVGVAVVGIGL